MKTSFYKFLAISLLSTGSQGYHCAKSVPGSKPGFGKRVAKGGAKLILALGASFFAARAVNMIFQFKKDPEAMKKMEGKTQELIKDWDNLGEKIQKIRIRREIPTSQDLQDLQKLFKAWQVKYSEVAGLFGVLEKKPNFMLSSGSWRKIGTFLQEALGLSGKITEKLSILKKNPMAKVFLQQSKYCQDILRGAPRLFEAFFSDVAMALKDKIEAIIQDLLIKDTQINKDLLAGQNRGEKLDLKGVMSRVEGEIQVMEAKKKEQEQHRERVMSARGQNSYVKTGKRNLEKVAPAGPSALESANQAIRKTKNDIDQAQKRLGRLEALEGARISLFEELSLQVDAWVKGRERVWRSQKSPLLAIDSLASWSSFALENKFIERKDLKNVDVLFARPLLGFTGKMHDSLSSDTRRALTQFADNHEGALFSVVQEEVGALQKKFFGLFLEAPKALEKKPAESEKNARASQEQGSFAQKDAPQKDQGGQSFDFDGEVSGLSDGEDSGIFPHDKNIFKISEERRVLNPWSMKKFNAPPEDEYLGFAKAQSNPQPQPEPQPQPQPQPGKQVFEFLDGEDSDDIEDEESSSKIAPPGASGVKLSDPVKIQSALPPQPQPQSGKQVFFALEGEDSDGADTDDEEPASTFAPPGASGVKLSDPVKIQSALLSKPQSGKHVSQFLDGEGSDDADTDDEENAIDQFPRNAIPGF